MEKEATSQITKLWFNNYVCIMYVCVLNTKFSHNWSFSLLMQNRKTQISHEIKNIIYVHERSVVEILKQI